MRRNAAFREPTLTSSANRSQRSKSPPTDQVVSVASVTLFSNHNRTGPVEEEAEAEATRLSNHPQMAAILARKSLQALRARQLVRTLMP